MLHGYVFVVFHCLFFGSHTWRMGPQLRKWLLKGVNQAIYNQTTTYSKWDDLPSWSWKLNGMILQVPLSEAIIMQQIFRALVYLHEVGQLQERKWATLAEMPLHPWENSRLLNPQKVMKLWFRWFSFSRLGDFYWFLGEPAIHFPFFVLKLQPFWLQIFNASFLFLCAKRKSQVARLQVARIIHQVQFTWWPLTSWWW